MTDTYEQVTYWSLPHHNADPNRIAAVAQLHGLQPPDPRTARVLELGCGDGGNSMAIAATWPEACCVGYDLSAAAIERGRELVGAAGLGDRVQLHVGDILEVTPPGEFDVVVIHGVLGWVPDEVRAAAFRVAAQALAPGGLVMGDYNALPGSLLWTTSRHLLRAGGSAAADASSAVRAARELVQVAEQLRAPSGLHSQLLGMATRRLETRTTQLVFHDDMNPYSRPFPVTELAALAEHAGLGYVGELRSEQWWDADPDLAAFVHEFAGDDPVEGQRVADLVRGPQFKGTVFARADEAARCTPLSAERAVGLVVHQAPLTGTEADVARGTPEQRALLDATATAGARGTRVADAKTGLAALQLAAERMVSLRLVHPPAAADLPERPRVPALVRAQVAKMQLATTQLHDYLPLESPLAPTVLHLLDGSRDRADVLAELARRVPPALMDPDRLPGELDALLDRFVAEGVFVDEEGAAAHG